MRKILFVIVLTVFSTLLMSNSAKAQGEAAVPFLLLAPDSRAGGIGESGVALADNANAVFWNPAGIAFLDGSEVSFTHSNWLPQFNLDLFYEYAAYRQYVPSLNGSIFASITYMNFGEFIRTSSMGPEPIGTFRSFDAAATIGYATKLTPSLALGGNFRLIHSRLAEKGTELEQGKGIATTVSFDIAMLYRPQKLYLPLVGDFSKRFSFGMNLSNLGPKIYYIDQAQADPIPTNLRWGIALKLLDVDYNSITYTLDFSKLLVHKRHKDTLTGIDIPPDGLPKSLITSWTDEPFIQELRQIVTSMGLEYWYGMPGDFMFAFRTGFFYEDPAYGNRKFVSLGAGIKYDMYGFDFSYISTSMFKGQENHPLNETLRFTLSIAWGGKPASSKGFPSGPYSGK